MFTINPRDGKAFSQPVSPKGRKLARRSNVGAFWFTAWVIAGAEKNFLRWPPIQSCENQVPVFCTTWKDMVQQSWYTRHRKDGDQTKECEACHWPLYSQMPRLEHLQKNPAKILRSRCTETIHVGFFQAMPKAQKVTSTNWTALPRNMFTTKGDYAEGFPRSMGYDKPKPGVKQHMKNASNSYPVVLRAHICRPKVFQYKWLFVAAKARWPTRLIPCSGKLWQGVPKCPPLT